MAEKGPDHGQHPQSEKTSDTGLGIFGEFDKTGEICLGREGQKHHGGPRSRQRVRRGTWEELPGLCSSHVVKHCGHDDQGDEEDVQNKETKGVNPIL